MPRESLRRKENYSPRCLLLPSGKSKAEKFRGENRASHSLGLVILVSNPYLLQIYDLQQISVMYYIL